MDWIWNIISLVFVFIAIGFCIFIHELGHFLAAKWRGLHIDAFSLGFKPFWRKKINGVEYRLGWLPFGGYVELPQVDATDATPHAADGTELPRAKPLDRIITAFAGPLFNILSGMLLACIIWWVGLPQDTPKMRELTVLTVDEAGPEWKAGLRPNDKIVRINGEPFHSTWREIILNKILLTVGEVTFDVVRGDQTLTIAYTPEFNPKAPKQLREEKIAWPFFTVLTPIRLTPAPNSPALAAGVRAEDILLAINGKPLAEPSDVNIAVNQAGNRNESLTLTLLRKGETIETKVTPKATLTEKGTPVYTDGLGFPLASTGTPGIEVLLALPESPAQRAGILPGDRIVKWNSEPITSFEDYEAASIKADGKPSVIELLRKGETITLELLPMPRYQIGVSLAMYDYPNPIQQFVYTFEMSRKSLIGISVWVGNKLGLTPKTSSISPAHMSGPLGMGTIIFTTTRLALQQVTPFTTVVNFIVIISFALAIFNLFPLPVLDGGHIVFGVFEIVFRKPLPTVVIKSLSMVFIVLLIGLMIFVTISDSRRLARTSGLTEKISNWFPGEAESVAPVTEAENVDPATK